MSATVEPRVMGRAGLGALRTVGHIAGEDITAMVRHGKASPVGPFPGCEVYGIQRATDGAWAWAFIEHPTFTVRHVSTWSQR